MKKSLIGLLSLLAATLVNAQPQPPTFAEKLGFPKGKKVVIFHVDDAGMSYESNQGTIKSMEQGLANSASVMMPCGWVPQFFDYLKQHPQVDAGVHLVLTSEFKNYRWHPLVGREKGPGLYDQYGAFWPNVQQVVQHASADEVEAEIRAQIARFRSFGVEPTHIDSHMGTLFDPKFLERYIKAGITEKIPVMFPGGHATLIASDTRMTPELRQTARLIGQQLWNAGLPVIDDLHSDSYGWNLPNGTPVTDENLRKHKTEKYIELLKACQPGITFIINHATDTGNQFAQISNSGPTRKGDMLAMMDPALKAFIEKEGIILTTWRELISRRKQVK
ncbi:carbohydrate deacetylase [Nibrella saemangeumensis]|uniref:Carbohydrate deacetylase n=1 Tax=Nibrella saemangeumensis TaxID=1084526 RepID=A0ABP8MC94_9BACT